MLPNEKEVEVDGSTLNEDIDKRISSSLLMAYFQFEQKSQQLDTITALLKLSMTLRLWLLVGTGVDVQYIC